MTEQLRTVRPWPKTVKKTASFLSLVESFRAAFDADPGATFCAGERDGITVVVAVGDRGRELRRLVENRWDGLVEDKNKP